MFHIRITGVPSTARIAGCRVVAPTERMVHPDGAAAQLLESLPARPAADELRLLDTVWPFTIPGCPSTTHSRCHAGPNMHEASLAGGILKLIEDSAQREGFVRVKLLRLEAGQLAGVEARALRFALEAMAPGTLLQGAQVEIDEPVGRAWCMRCSASVVIEQRGDPCTSCGGYPLQTTGGTELRVVELLVEDH